MRRPLAAPFGLLLQFERPFLLFWDGGIYLQSTLFFSICQFLVTVWMRRARGALSSWRLWVYIKREGNARTNLVIIVYLVIIESLIHASDDPVAADDPAAGAETRALKVQETLTQVSSLLWRSSTVLDNENLSGTSPFLSQEHYLYTFTQYWCLRASFLLDITKWLCNTILFYVFRLFYSDELIS